MDIPLRFTYSYPNQRVMGGPPDPKQQLYFHLWEWCFNNLRRPATVTFYSNSGRYQHSAQLYRRRTKTLTKQIASWSGHLRDADGTLHNDRVNIFYEICFEDEVDQELFLLAWLGQITIAGLGDLPYTTVWADGLLTN